MTPEHYIREDDELWRGKAACRRDGVTTSDWFPKGKPGRLVSQSREEMEFIQAHQCYAMECPVIPQCRRYAVLTDQDHGVWGGLAFSDPNARAQAQKEVFGDEP